LVISGAIMASPKRYRSLPFGSGVHPGIRNPATVEP
jgi:hypothetical protein